MEFKVGNKFEVLKSERQKDDSVPLTGSKIEITSLDEKERNGTFKVRYKMLEGEPPKDEGLYFWNDSEFSGMLKKIK